MNNQLNFDLGLAAAPNPGIEPKLYDELAAIHKSLRLLADQVAGGNMLEWVDYSADSTIVGWSSFTTKELVYRYLNLDTVLVNFRLIGVSNSTVVSFTLPGTNGMNLRCPIGLTGDNSVLSTVLGQVSGASGSNVIQVYKDATAAIWTASGTKSVAGQFIYRSV